MDRNTKELFKIFEIGVENERKAQEFYKDLIAKSRSEMEKQIFLNFLEEERKHEQKLMQMYADMKEQYNLR
ncbi:MAG: hypothetical protein HY787_02765 [Deltaproteobacteria bacterium]|nr:hypothetical protein [Deltaproteobacteria bacterium]